MDDSYLHCSFHIITAERKCKSRQRASVWKNLSSTIQSWKVAKKSYQCFSVTWKMVIVLLATPLLKEVLPALRVTRLSDIGLIPARRCWVKNLSLIHVVLSSIKASYFDGRLLLTLKKKTQRFVLRLKNS